MDDNVELVSLEVGPGMWDRFFTVAPLVVVGTRGGGRRPGSYGGGAGTGAERASCSTGG